MDHALGRALPALAEQIERGLAFTRDEGADTTSLRAEARAVTRAFALALPAIRGQLVSDLRAAFAGDPAATNFPEILLGYPGMTAVIHHRLAHALIGSGATPGGAAHLPKSPIADRHRHPSRRADRRAASSSITAPAW